MRPVLLTILALGTLQAQKSVPTARELYYAPAPPETAAKPPDKATSPRTGQRTTKVATHFGVRYNLLKVTDRKANTTVPVDPDGNLKANDCVELQLRPNRGGRLYVFNRGSSGKWQVLLPSSEARNEPSLVRAGADVLVPREHCFLIDENRGVETLRVVVTDEEDAGRLSDTMRNETESGKPAPGLMTAQEMAVELDAGGMLASRDLKLMKVGASKDPDEPAYSVYAVQPRTSGNRMVLEIKIRHE